MSRRFTRMQARAATDCGRRSAAATYPDIDFRALSASERSDRNGIDMRHETASGLTRAAHCEHTLSFVANLAFAAYVRDISIDKPRGKTAHSPSC
jgi:hypothetical protein